MRTAVTRAALYAPALLTIVLVPGRAMAGGGRTADPKASSDEKKKDAASPKDAEQAPTAVQPGESGLVVIRDPDTGELGAPQGRQIETLLRGAVPSDNNSHEGLVTVRSPDGTETIDLKGRFQSFFMVTRAEDGSLKSACVDHQPGAHAHAQPPAAPQAAPAAQGEDR